MKFELAKQIFKQHNLGIITNIKKIDVGFTNHVYLVDDNYILKVCVEEENEKNIEKEVYLYRLLSEKIPVPDVLVYDTSKMLFDKHYLIYKKIEGENLYNVWHTMTDEERKNMVKELSAYLRVINQTPYDAFVDHFQSEQSSWRETVTLKINKSLSVLEKKDILSVDVIQQVKAFVQKNASVLDEAVLGFVHWDTHFDNVLVKDEKIVGLLDFERIEIASIDYVLDMIARMQRLPSKYMSEYAEQFVKDEDYAQLMIWFEAYAPELFAFDQMDKRLALYDLMYELKMLIWFPEEDDLKEHVSEILIA